MIKVNGQRVELGEVEARLAGHPQVDAAACRAFTDGEGQTYLVAYYTPAHAANMAKTSSEPIVGEAALRGYLAESLPSHMVPRFFVRLEALPLNANGKINRAALPEPNVDAWRSAYVAPTTKRENQVCEAFEQALELDRIGMDDDFFALGGDSIRVMRLVSLLAQGGIAASSRLLLDCHTPRALCAALDEAESPRKNELPRLTDYPLSQTQLGIYAECAASPTSCSIT